MAEKLEIDALRALRAIASQGGVTRAADHMGLSQSAVSHKIRRLETALDCTLLSRKPGAPLFTDAGNRLHGYAQRMIDLHDEALAELGKKPLKGTLRLGLTEDTTTSDIARILGRFTRVYPNVSVETRASQSLNIQKWLKSGDLDLAVMQVFDDDVVPTDKILFHDTLHWVKAPDFPLNPDYPVPFLSFDENCFYRAWAFSQGRAWGHEFIKVLECPSAAGIQSAVSSGLGVALLNGLHVTAEMDIIDGVFPPPPDLTFVLRANGQNNIPAVHALTQEIQKELST